MNEHWIEDVPYVGTKPRYRLTRRGRIAKRYAVAAFFLALDIACLAVATWAVVEYLFPN